MVDDMQQLTLDRHSVCRPGMAACVHTRELLPLDPADQVVVKFT